LTLQWAFSSAMGSAGVVLWDDSFVVLGLQLPVAVYLLLCLTGSKERMGRIGLNGVLLLQ
jgi:Mn2+/Fe2+ NRAMP family transporter